MPDRAELPEVRRLLREKRAVAILGARQIVGRVRELDLLVDSWERVVEEEGRTVFISGEAGMGKLLVDGYLGSLPSAVGGSRKRLWQESSTPNRIIRRTFGNARDRGVSTGSWYWPNPSPYPIDIESPPHISG